MFLFLRDNIHLCLLSLIQGRRGKGDRGEEMRKRREGEARSPSPVTVGGDERRDYRM